MSTPRTPFKASAGPAPGSLTLSGTLDFVTAPIVFAQSAEWLRSDISELDLAALSNADSAALAMLVVWAGQAQRRGKPLHFHNVPQGLRALAKSCDVDKVLDIRE